MMPTAIIAGAAIISVGGSNNPAIAIARIDRCNVIVVAG
jgi:hypothetical protein